MSHYLDSSVLVAYYTPEPLSERAQSSIVKTRESAISWLCQLEFASAVSRKVRTGEFARPDAEQALALLREHVAQRVYRMLPLEPAHYAQAQRWLELMATSLRAADALHLSLAAQSGCRLLTADRSLADSARRHDVPYKLLTA